MALCLCMFAFCRHTDPLLDMDALALMERRRALRAELGPDLDTSDDRLRKGTFDTPASSMFWDELDDPRKAKALSKGHCCHHFVCCYINVCL